jgi:hypothetical protein
MRLFFSILLLRKEGLPYFHVFKNKYEEDDYEELFVKIPRIIFKVLNFAFMIS